jgi:hypothetical protein
VDRHPTALAAAALATLAVGCKDPSGPLFEGSDALDMEQSTVKGLETRAWKITTEVSLPRQAEPSSFESTLEMDIEFSSAQASMDAAFVVRECDGGTVLENLSFPREGDTESLSDESYEVWSFLADCPIQKACEQTLCVEGSNHRSGALGLSLGVQVTLLSDAPADDSDTINVPIELTLEEIVP